MSRIVGNIYDIMNGNVKRSSFVWKRAIKSVNENWKSFTPEQSAGILLAIYKSNLHQSEEASKIANLFVKNAEKYVTCSDFNLQAAIKITQLYYELDSTEKLKFDTNILENLLLFIIKNINCSDIDHATALLPLLAISSSKSQVIQIDLLNNICHTLITHIRSNSTQSFNPSDSHKITNLVEKISLLTFLISKYNNLNPTDLLLLLGESLGNLASLIRLHYAIDRLKGEFSLSNHLKTLVSQLNEQTVWNSKSQLLDSIKLICNYRMYESKYIGKIYQNISNSIESFDKFDRMDINLYLKCTIDKVDPNDQQFHFLNKLHSIKLITKPHRANIKWNSPLIIN